MSAKVLGAIEEPDRFQIAKQVLKMGGLDLSEDRSGKNSDKAIPEISKRGKANLRYALYQAAFIASTKNRDFMRYYTSKLRGREKEKGAPVLALSGLLTIAFDSMKETIAALKEAELRDKVKVMIGGGLVNQVVCDYTGADAAGGTMHRRQ